MREEVGGLNRRDLIKVGAAVAGAALLPPAAVRLSTGLVDMPSNAAVDRPAEPASFPTSLRPAKLKQPNIVLMVLDTVRADHLSCYGYHRNTTPNLDAFAAGARVYKNVLSPGPYTLPSHASFFTGLSSSAHGAHWLHIYLDKQFETLASQLTAGGYQTIGTAANGAFLVPESGFSRGFQDYRNVVSAGDVNRRVANWLATGYDPKKPFFLFLNYMEAHQPYNPPRELLQFTATSTWEKWQKLDQAGFSVDVMLTGDVSKMPWIGELESLYDDAIWYLDSQLRDLLAFLQSPVIEENTVVFILSDHGEHFGEHARLSHQFSVYEPLVRVPLIARGPERFPVGTEDRLVQSHDVYPTILELAGLAWNRLPGQTCRSLVQPLSETRYGISEYIVPDVGTLAKMADVYREFDSWQFSRSLRAIQKEKMKLIRPSVGDLELYDLADDPLETRNLVGLKPEVTTELAEALDTWYDSFEHYAAVPRRPTGKLKPTSPETLEQMRGLGYVQ